MLVAVQNGEKVHELVVVPTVLQDSMISMKTMTSTPMMKTSGGVGVTYGAGQKVLNMSITLLPSDGNALTWSQQR